MACTAGNRSVSWSQAAKRWAAIIGPTVCELDGPMPILKMSKQLILMIDTPGRMGSSYTPQVEPPFLPAAAATYFPELTELCSFPTNLSLQTKHRLHCRQAILAIEGADTFKPLAQFLGVFLQPGRGSGFRILLIHNR